MSRRPVVASLVVGLLASAWLLIGAAPAAATYSSVVSGGGGVMTGNASSDILFIDFDGGTLLRHNRFTAGDSAFSSDTDWDSTVAGPQTLNSNLLHPLSINAGAGNDKITIASNAGYASSTVNGGLGTDTIATGIRADAIDVVDGEADTVSCGTGADVVSADPADQVASDCETVTRVSPSSGAPINQFTFGKLKRNLDKGTATLTVNVPNPGTLSLTGKGLKSQRSSGRTALASKAVGAAGQVKLTIKAKGNKKTKLNSTGKVKVKAKVTFTPTGGTGATQTKKITLKKTL